MQYKFNYNIFKGPFHVPPEARLVFVHNASFILLVPKTIHNIQACRMCRFFALLSSTMFKYVTKTPPRHPTQLFKTSRSTHASSLQWTNQRLQLTLLGWELTVPSANKPYFTSHSSQLAANTKRTSYCIEFNNVALAPTQAYYILTTGLLTPSLLTHIERLEHSNAQTMSLCNHGWIHTTRSTQTNQINPSMKRVDECNSLACSHYCKQTPKQYQYP